LVGKEIQNLQKALNEGTKGENLVID